MQRSSREICQGTGKMYTFIQITNAIIWIMIILVITLGHMSFRFSRKNRLAKSPFFILRRQIFIILEFSEGSPNKGLSGFGLRTVYFYPTHARCSPAPVGNPIHNLMLVSGQVSLMQRRYICHRYLE